MPFGYGGTALISGNRGCGKSTIVMKMRPTRVLSSEQEPEQLAHLYYRLFPDGEKHVPIISGCYSWEDLLNDIQSLVREEIVVVDSVSQLAESHETPDIVRVVVEHVRRASARAFFVAQFTKIGETLGPNALSHLVDVVATIPDDSSGMRRMVVEKNRFGNLTSTYFELAEEGPVPISFDQNYSVEGPAGNYRLQHYPMPGRAHLTGILDAFDAAGVKISGIASSAMASSIYETGFTQPGDWSERKRFAEMHGLRWVGPEEAIDMLGRVKRDKKEKTDDLPDEIVDDLADAMDEGTEDDT